MTDLLYVLGHLPESVDVFLDDREVLVLHLLLAIADLLMSPSPRRFPETRRKNGTRYLALGTFLANEGKHKNSEPQNQSQNARPSSVSSIQAVIQAFLSTKDAYPGSSVIHVFVINLLKLLCYNACNRLG